MKSSVMALAALFAVACGAAASDPQGEPPPPPVSFQSNGVALVGEIHRPGPSGALAPGVVLVHGSGRFERSSSRRVAAKLAAKGLVVLLYDKRGVGDSGGRYRDVNPENSEAQLAELADDANHALRFLSSQPGVDADRVGLFGGSQAGWVMPLAIARGGPARFMIVVSGPAISVGLEIKHGLLTREGKRNLPAAEVQRALESFAGPHGYDPMPTLRKLNVPTLWIMGARDQNLPLDRTLRNLQTLPATVSGLLTIKTIAEADHQMRMAGGGIFDYAEETMNWLRTKGLVDAYGLAPSRDELVRPRDR